MFERGRDAGWPAGPPPSRNRGPLIAVITFLVVLLLAGAITLVAVNLGSNSQASNPPPVASTLAPTTSTTPTTRTSSSADPSEPSSQQTFVDPVVDGWRGISWPGYHAAYDVPPSWQPKPGHVYGVGDDTGNNNVLVSGVSVFMENYCADSHSSYRALAGLTSSQVKDTTAAATDTIQKWATYGFTSPSGAAAQVSKPSPQPVTLGGGLHATVASATITPPKGDKCASPTEAISVVAVPSSNGSGIMIAVSDEGVPDVLSPQDLQKIVMSFRQTK